MVYLRKHLYTSANQQKKIIKIVRIKKKQKKNI